MCSSNKSTMILWMYLYIKRRRKKVKYALLLATFVLCLYRALKNHPKGHSVLLKREEDVKNERTETCVAVFAILHFRIQSNLNETTKKDIREELEKYTNTTSAYLFLDDRFSDSGLPVSMQERSYHIKGSGDGDRECGYVWGFDTNNQEVVYDTCKGRTFKNSWKFCKLPAHIVKEVTTQGMNNFDDLCSPNLVASWPLQDMKHCAKNSNNDMSDWVKYARSLDKDLMDDVVSDAIGYEINAWQVLGLVVEYDKIAGFSFITTEASERKETTGIMATSRNSKEPRTTSIPSQVIRDSEMDNNFGNLKHTVVQITSTPVKISSQLPVVVPDEERAESMTAMSSSSFTTLSLVSDTADAATRTTTVEEIEENDFSEKEYLEMLQRIYPEFFSKPSEIVTKIPIDNPKFNKHDFRSGANKYDEFEGSGEELSTIEPTASTTLITIGNEVMEDLVSLRRLIHKIYGVVIDNLPVPLESLLVTMHNMSDHTHVRLPDDHLKESNDNNSKLHWVAGSLSNDLHMPSSSSTLRTSTHSINMPTQVSSPVTTDENYSATHSHLVHSKATVSTKQPVTTHTTKPPILPNAPITTNAAVQDKEGDSIQPDSVTPAANFENTRSTTINPPLLLTRATSDDYAYLDIGSFASTAIFVESKDNKSPTIVSQKSSILPTATSNSIHPGSAISDKSSYQSTSDIQQENSKPVTIVNGISATKKPLIPSIIDVPMTEVTIKTNKEEDLTELYGLIQSTSDPAILSTQMTNRQQKETSPEVWPTFSSNTPQTQTLQDSSKHLQTGEYVGVLRTVSGNVNTGTPYVQEKISDIDEKPETTDITRTSSSAAHTQPERVTPDLGSMTSFLGKIDYSTTIPWSEIIYSTDYDMERAIPSSSSIAATKTSLKEPKDIEKVVKSTSTTELSASSGAVSRFPATTLPLSELFDLDETSTTAAADTMETTIAKTQTALGTKSSATRSAFEQITSISPVPTIMDVRKESTETLGSSAFITGTSFTSTIATASQFDSDFVKTATQPPRRPIGDKDTQITTENAKSEIGDISNAVSYARDDVTTVSSSESTNLSTDGKGLTNHVHSDLLYSSTVSVLSSSISAVDSSPTNIVTRADNMKNEKSGVHMTDQVTESLLQNTSGTSSLTGNDDSYEKSTVKPHGLTLESMHSTSSGSDGLAKDTTDDVSPLSGNGQNSGGGLSADSTSTEQLTTMSLQRIMTSDAYQAEGLPISGVTTQLIDGTLAIIPTAVASTIPVYNILKTDASKLGIAQESDTTSQQDDRTESGNTKPVVATPGETTTPFSSIMTSDTFKQESTQKANVITQDDNNIVVPAYGATVMSLLSIMASDASNVDSPIQQTTGEVYRTRSRTTISNPVASAIPLVTMTSANLHAGRTAKPAFATPKDHLTSIASEAKTMPNTYADSLNSENDSNGKEEHGTTMVAGTLSNIKTDKTSSNPIQTDENNGIGFNSSVGFSGELEHIVTSNTIEDHAIPSESTVALDISKATASTQRSIFSSGYTDTTMSPTAVSTATSHLIGSVGDSRTTSSIENVHHRNEVAYIPPKTLPASSEFTMNKLSIQTLVTTPQSPVQQNGMVSNPQISMRPLDSTNVMSPGESMIPPANPLTQTTLTTSIKSITENPAATQDIRSTSLNSIYASYGMTPFLVGNETTSEVVTEVASAIVGKWFQYSLPAVWKQKLKTNTASSITVKSTAIVTPRPSTSGLISNQWLVYHQQLETLCGIPVAKSRSVVNQISTFRITLMGDTGLVPVIVLHISLHPLPELERPDYEVVMEMDIKNSDGLDYHDLASRYPALFILKLVTYLTKEDTKVLSSDINMHSFDFIHKQRKKRSSLFPVKLSWNIDNTSFTDFNSTFKNALFKDLFGHPKYDFFVALLPQFIIKNIFIKTNSDRSNHHLKSIGHTNREDDSPSVIAILAPIFIGLFAVISCIGLILIRKRKPSSYPFTHRFSDNTYSPRKPIYLDEEIEMDHFKPSKARIIAENDICVASSDAGALASRHPSNSTKRGSLRQQPISDTDKNSPNTTSPDCSVALEGGDISSDVESIDGYYSFASFSFSQ